jgi:hypothetical protein
LFGFHSLPHACEEAGQLSYTERRSEGRKSALCHKSGGRCFHCSSLLCSRGVRVFALHDDVTEGDLIVVVGVAGGSFHEVVEKAAGDV